MSEKAISLNNLARYKQNSDNLYAKQDGYYFGLGAGTADNLTPYSESSGVPQHVPFVFQSTAGGSDVGALCQLKMLRGQSYVLNQLVDSDTSSVGTISGHKYLTDISGVRSIITGDGTDLSVSGGTDQVIDLTLMFGAGKEPSTVVEFNRLFPLSYYSYSAGQLVNCQASKLTTIGYNQFDGVLEQGGIGEIGGSTYTSTTDIRSKNYIKVIAGQKYTWANETLVNHTDTTNRYLACYDGSKNYIERISFGNTISTTYLTTNDLPDNCVYVKVVYYCTQGIAPNNITNVCIHLTWDGSRTGYEEYVKNEYPLPNVELRSAGDAYDEIKPNGTLIRRIGVREYQAGDENNADVLTDLTNTYYKLSTPTTMQIVSFSSNVKVDDFGTMEFDSDYPQGNDFFYYVDYKAFIDSLGGREDINFDASKVVSHSELTSALSGIDLSGYASLDGINYYTGDNDFLGELKKNGVDVATINQISDEYDNTKTYALGDLVIHNNVLYKCTTAITTAENWDATHWTETSVASDFVNLTGTQTITGAKNVLDTFISFLNSQASGNAEYILEENQYGQLVISRKYNNNKVALWCFDGYRFNPMADNANDIGQSNRRTKNIYLSGKIKDGTNEVSVAEICKKPSTSYSLTDGGTISDDTLKSLIQNEQPIKLNGFTCYFSCDDGTNYQYVSTRYDSSANKNHINVITINKSTWVATFNTSDLALS